MKIWRLIILIQILCIAVCDALSQDIQNVKLYGSVCNDDNLPMPFASVFIRETMTGTATNIDGLYQLQVPCNQNIQIVVQAVGFAPQQIDLNISTNKELNIVLQKSDIQQIIKKEQAEDPAYEIMRKAIVNAPLHLNEVERYKANLYIKGTLRVFKIPNILVGKMDDLLPEVGKTYVMESANRVEYTAPNEYKHIVLAEQSSIPNFLIDKDIRLRYFNFNFYNINNDDVVVSPLSNYAFTYYRFEYLGYTMSFGKRINHIKVVPKHQSKQLFEGEIHIVDETWQLSYVNLLIETAIGDINVVQNFIPIKHEIWLPIFQNYTLDMLLLGVVGQFDYIGSLQYTNVDYTTTETTLREAITMDEKVLAERLGSSKKVKQYRHNATKLNEILESETLDNASIHKSGRYWRRLLAISDTADRRSEITDRLKYAVIDSTTSSFDEQLMSRMRRMPLTDIEIESLRDAELSNLMKDKPKRKKGTTHELSKRNLLGEQAFQIVKDVDITLSGINANMLYYHPVTGVGLEQEFGLRYQKEKFTMRVGLKAGYAFSPQKFQPQLNGQINIGNYNLSFSAGDEYIDWRGDAGDPRFTNSIISFFIKKNHKVLVEDKYRHFDITSSPLWGVKINASLHIDDYLSTDNHTNYSFFKRNKKFNENIPNNIYITEASLADGCQATASLDAEYTPRLMYYIDENGQRISQGSRWPTFNIMYKQSLGSLFDSESDFSQVAMTITRKKNFALTDKVDWEIGAGAMFHTEDASFADWKHFAGSRKMVAISDMASGYKGFVMFDAYTLSTNDWYANVALHYQSQSLLIKKIPIFRNLLNTEELFFKSVMFGGKDVYSELGYGLGHVFLVFRATAFVSFINEKYQAINFRMSVSIPKLNGK